ncbi:unnamed protein product [Amaranthus hypochondriacus]
MDESIAMSSTNKMMITQLSDPPSANSCEESSWTFYFEHFLTNNHSHISSMVSSDAAKLPKNLNMYCNNNTFFDDDLEDTATSPHHSPKEYDSNQFQRDRKDNYHITISQENEESSKHEEEGNSMSFLETQLRRKGLCLVPMSMLIKHLN